MTGARVRSDDTWERLFSENGIPTIAKMMAIPMWAAVAFAGRCGRRAQPALQICWPDAPKRDRDVVEYCLRITEGRLGFRLVQVNSLIDDLTNAFNDANRLRATSPPEMVARYQAALQASLVTAYCVKSALSGAKNYAADNASDAARAACAAVKPNFQIVSDIRADFAAVLECAQRERWDDDSQLEPLAFYATQSGPDTFDYESAE